MMDVLQQCVFILGFDMVDSRSFTLQCLLWLSNEELTIAKNDVQSEYMRENTLATEQEWYSSLWVSAIPYRAAQLFCLEWKCKNIKKKHYFAMFISGTAQ